MFFDVYYLILVVPALLLSMWAQVQVKTTFERFSKEAVARGMTGAQAAAYLLKTNNITDVKIEKVAGNLTDHYDPSHKVLRLSEPVFGKASIAAVGVAAHETGHAIQHATKYGPLVLRSTLVPVANIGSAVGPTLAILGLVLSFGFLVDLGLLLFAGAVLFYVVTLPVEFNASRRAIAILGKSGAMNQDELKGVKKVLSAAAMTYVASALSAIGNFVRLLLISRNRRD
ncbi:MAG: zinc metallopeptidase [Treponema sp.]|nr:zinc metallopeptidase [Spirochaetia bacterium]MDD7275996.1 zinc metallopeptidase [Treponema sp.]